MPATADATAVHSLRQQPARRSIGAHSVPRQSGAASGHWCGQPFLGVCSRGARPLTQRAPLTSETSVPAARMARSGDLSRAEVSLTVGKEHEQGGRLDEALHAFAGAAASATTEPADLAAKAETLRR